MPFSEKTSRNLPQASSKVVNRSGSKPIITSPPTTNVGVDLLFNASSSSSATGSACTSLYSNGTLRDCKNAFAAKHGGHPGWLYRITRFIAFF